MHKSLGIMLSEFISGTVSYLNSRDVNSKLYLAERQFLGKGLPQRPYYRHVIQAPGLFLGYDSQSFPGIAQTVRAKDWKAANQQVQEAAQQIQQTAEWLQQ